MRFPIRLRYSLRGLLVFCLGASLLAANFAPQHHEELEVDAATLRRIEHSWLPLNPADPVGPEIFTDVKMKGWPKIVYLNHRNPFSDVTAAISGEPLETHESYVDGRGVAINAGVAAIALIVCYLVPISLPFGRRSRAIPSLE
ncbi:MAG: hypothetical protein KDA42_19240 [Planctomycetales bacterium]|nr:hypothetical protein [Planctomycetales bacterium]